MGTAPWWFTPLTTLAAVLFGGVVSIVTAWLTQRYNLHAQLALKRAETESSAAAILTSEKEKRYLVIVRNLESLFENSQDPGGRTEFLRVVRELWLLGDEELVQKLNVFLLDIAGQQEASTREQLFGEAILEMRRGLGLPTDRLNSHDFRFHSPPSRST